MASLTYTGGTPTLGSLGTITLAPAAASFVYTAGLPDSVPTLPGAGTLIYQTFTPGVSLVLTTAAGNQLFIGGVSFGTWLEGTFTIDKLLAATNSASVSLRYRSGPKPSVKQDVAMFWGGVKRFGGLISQVDESSVPGDPFESQLDLTLTGYGSYLDRTVVAKLYTLPIGGSVAVILFDLWFQHLAAFGVTYAYGNNPAVGILDTLFHYVTLRQACTTLTDQTPGWSIWIDNNKALQLQETSAGQGGVAPFALNRASLDTTKSADTIKFTISDALFRNREWVIPSSNLVALLTDSWTGDGVTTAFNTVYALTGTPIVTVGGVAQQVDTLGIWTGAPCWWIPNGDGVFFHVAPGLGLAIDINYPTPFQLAFSAQNDASIAAVGLYEHVTQATNVTDQTTASAMALALLELYGPDAASPESISFTYNSAQQSAWLEPGQLMTVAWTFPDVSDDFVVQEVQSEEQGLSLWRHTVTLAKGATGDLTGAADLQGLVALLALNNVNLPHVATMELAIGGGLTVGLQPNFIRFKGNGVIQSWDARFPTDPPTGASVIIDLLKNGVSIFPAGTVNEINIPDGDTNEQDGFGFVSANLAYSDGDLLTMNVIQVGSTNPGSSAVVHLNLIPTLAAGG